MPHVLGFDNRIYYKGSQGWTVLPEGGLGKDIGVDFSGRIWVIGTDDQIWINPRTPASWSVYLGKAQQAIALAISSSGDAYIVGKNNHAYKANGTDWTELPGGMTGATDIAVDGRGRPWVLDSPGRTLFLESSKWYEYPGERMGTALTVSRDGVPFIVGTDSCVYEGTMTGWKALSGNGKARHLAIDAAGQVWAIGLDYGIWWHEGEEWRRCSGGMKGIRIALP